MTWLLGSRGKGSIHKPNYLEDISLPGCWNNLKSLHWYFNKTFRNTHTKKSQHKRLDTLTATAHLWYAANRSQSFPTETVCCQPFKVLGGAYFWGVVFNCHNCNISYLDSIAIVPYFYFVKPIILLKKRIKHNGTLKQPNELRLKFEAAKVTASSHPDRSGSFAYLEKLSNHLMSLFKKK